MYRLPDPPLMQNQYPPGSPALPVPVQTEPGQNSRAGLLTRPGCEMTWKEPEPPPSFNRIGLLFQIDPEGPDHAADSVVSRVERTGSHGRNSAVILLVKSS